MDRSDPPRSRAAACVALIAAAHVVAAVCRVGWTWDGSFLFFRILEDGVLPVPHDRWANIPPMATLAWASRWIDDIDTLAAIYGASYLVLGTLAFATSIAMLRGPLARMRPWIAVGVLFVPLPGAMCPTMEVTPCLQLVWPLVAWTWAGYPMAFAPIIAALTLMLWGLHPLAAPLLVLVAASAWHARPKAHKQRIVAWTLSTIAAARCWVAATSLDAYEREQLQLWKILEELGSVTFLAPVAVVVVVMAWAAHAARRHGGITRAPVSQHMHVWLIAFAIGVWFMHEPAYWSGGFNYRKFGVVAVAPMMWLAARDAAVTQPVVRRTDGALLWMPCVAYAGLLTLGSLGWHAELTRLGKLGASTGSRIVDGRRVPGIVGSPLYHWSGTVTSILVQGRRPSWVLLSHGVVLDDVGIRLWTSEVALPFEHDGRGARPFDLSLLRR